MSSERYRVVRQLECDTYYVGCPVQIEKGNILLDNQTSNLILQLKLYNVSDKTISAVYLSADYYDNTNHLLHSGMELNYLGLNCAAKQACGSDTPMKLPDNNIYNVKLNIVKVMFIDGSMINVAPQTIQIPKQQQIAEVFGNEAAGAAKRVLNNSVCYIPQELDSGVWLCGCGQASEKEDCVRCGIAKNKVFEIVDNDYLHNEILEYNKILKNKAKRKQKKIIGIVSIIVLSIILSITLYNFLNPDIKEIKTKLSGTWVSDDNNERLYFKIIDGNMTLNGNNCNLYKIHGIGKSFNGFIKSSYRDDEKIKIKLNDKQIYIDNICYYKIPPITIIDDSNIIDTSEISYAVTVPNKRYSNASDIHITFKDTSTKKLQAMKDSNIYVYWTFGEQTERFRYVDISDNKIILSLVHDEIAEIVETEINNWE